MNEKQEKRKRYNSKLEYMAQFEKWLASEPPMMCVFKWRKWKKNKPMRSTYGQKNT